MTEARIIELLQQIYSNEQDMKLKFNEHSRLIPEHVDQLSKFMANSIYETLKENNSSSNSKRMDFIQLLRRWCPIDDNHFNINEYNFELILDSYSEEVEKDGASGVLHELNSRFENLPSSNILASLKEYYNKSDMRTDEKLKHLEYINQMNQNKLENSDFFKTKGSIRLDKIDNFLNNFVSDISAINSHEVPKVKCSQQLLNISRENRIKFVYSTLNLKHNRKLSLLIKNTLEEIASQSVIAPDEMELAVYLWENGVNGHVLSILKLFPFIYEKPLINLCNQLIDSTDDNEKFNFIEKFKEDQGKLIEDIKILGDVKFKVINMLNELFILSDYDENVLSIAKLFNSH